MSKTKVVTIGGGSGQYALLCALRDIHSILVTAIVAMSDSGGSSGRLRDHLGILPPGDMLKCLIALSSDRDVYRRTFQTRFDASDGHELDGHNLGNIMLSYFSQNMTDYAQGIKGVAKRFGVKGCVVPVTTEKITLFADLETLNRRGETKRIFGESEIDKARTNGVRITRVDLAPHKGITGPIEAYPGAIQAILEADIIVIGPGDLYTSLMPNLLVDDMCLALSKAKARIIYIGNLMTKFGETNGYSLRDFVTVLERYIERPLDLIVANDRLPSTHFLERYALERAEIIKAELPEGNFPPIIKADLLDEGEVLRHSDEKLRKLFEEVILTPK